MNEALKALKERRSIRKFKEEIPPKEVIDQIIEAGLYAPSGSNKQETIILCVTDKKLRDRIMQVNEYEYKQCACSRRTP